MRKIESIIKWSGSITCKLVQHTKRQSGVLGAFSASAVSFLIHRPWIQKGENWNECPYPFSKSDGFFSALANLLSAPCTLILFPRAWWEDLFPGFIENLRLVLLQNRTKVSAKGWGITGNALIFFRAHISCYFWANRGHELSYELTPSELFKCEKIAGYTSARGEISYFCPACWDYARNLLLSAGEKKKVTGFSSLSCQVGHGKNIGLRL